MLLLGSIFLIGHVQAKKTVIKRDSHFPTIYYNAEKFPQGLFDAHGKSQISDHFSSPALLAWDLNGVIFRKEYSITANLYQLAVTEDHGWMYTFKALASFGKLWRYKLHLKKQHDPRGYVWDAIFRTLENSEEGKQFATLLRKFSQQANVLDYDMIAILQELSAQGHRNTILSNMGEGLAQVNVNFLRRKLEKNILTENQRTATQFAIDFLTHPTNTIASPENNWLHKPMRESYQTCLQKHQGADKFYKVTLFVDDKFSNITAALDQGLFDIAIFYTNSADRKCTKLRNFLYKISEGKLVLHS